jgi:AT-rich interactive domain-containing protein 2
VVQNYQQSSNIHTTFIQSGTTQSMTNRKIVFTNAVDGTQTTAGGAKIMQAVQQSPAQHTLQSLAHGQNIIVQKGQKFQIGNTQISQVIQPAPAPPQQVQIIQKAMPPKIESPPVIFSKEIESKSPSPAVVEVPEAPVEIIEQPTSASTSGTSSPAPSQSQGKQQVSIQIPVPQSQIVGPNAQQYSIKIIPSMDPAKVKDEDVDPSWPFVCDWRGCPKKKFATANEVYLHACAVHCPSLDGTPDLFCQWGGGSSLCDNLPRKRFSLMTHIFDRHCTADAFKMAVAKRQAAAESGASNGPKQPYPVTLIRQPNNPAPQNDQNVNLMNGPTNIQNAGTAAMQAIKRHSIEFNIAKEAMVSWS